MQKFESVWFLFLLLASFFIILFMQLAKVSMDRAGGF